MSTNATDTQTWIFPPPGEAVPPVDATGEFGPVQLGDGIVLDWSPATNPEIDMRCFSKYGGTYATVNSVVVKFLKAGESMQRYKRTQFCVLLLRRLLIEYRDEFYGHFQTSTSTTYVPF
jgi:hypothetical protein